MRKSNFNCFDPFMPAKVNNINKKSKAFEENIEIMNEASFEFNRFATTTDKMQVRGPQVKQGFIVMVTSCEIGENNNLGKKLLREFLMALSQAMDLPQYIVFLNSAVKLITYDDECINIIKTMKKYGTGSVVSIESLEHYEALSDCKIGQKELSNDIMQKIIYAKQLIKI